ncbi:MAG TPA: DJ-1/PfpI family protein [Terriglobia bacterium]|nr:DJ-1/PfpI family protein [Terriglobia bacterium]
MSDPVGTARQTSDHLKTACGKPRSVAILLFPEVEVLDFAGPFEVFSIAAQTTEPSFQVHTVAAAPVVTVGGMRVTPGHDYESCPQADILLLPGGIGSRRAVQDRRLLDWVEAQAWGAEIVASICTGALLLGRLGLLDGLRVTTHWGALDLLRRVAPKAEVVGDSRFIDNGRILTSAGISAGIDMSLHLVARLCGGAAAAAVARQMEYEGQWRPAA